MSTISTARQKLIDQILTLLGNNIIDLDDHLTTKDIMTCIDLALDRYRQRSGNSVEESIAFLKLMPDVQEYNLPKEVIEVKEIFRRGLSPAGNESVGNEFDPFNVAYTNLYLLQAGGSYGLFTWELYNGYLETAGRLFGSKYNFTWDPRTKKLRLVRHQRIHEDVLLQLYNHVPDESLISDLYGGPWIRSYALAQCKMLLGQAYEKFSQIAGPQSGITLNGSALKAEATAELAQLDIEMKNYVPGGPPLTFIIG